MVSEVSRAVRRQSRIQVMSSSRVAVVRSGLCMEGSRGVRAL